jgi:hypothetical protein
VQRPTRRVGQVLDGAKETGREIHAQREVIRTELAAEPALRRIARPVDPDQVAPTTVRSPRRTVGAHPGWPDRHMRDAHNRNRRAHSFRKMLDPANGLAPGDPARMAAAMIASVDSEPAPMRIMLGSQALDSTIKLLQGRIAGFEDQRDLAASTDFAAGE